MKKWLLSTLAGLILVPAIAMSWRNIQEVWASPREIQELKKQQGVLVAQTTTIGDYVQQQMQEKEYEKERVASAPPGYRWDSLKREYVKRGV